MSENSENGKEVLQSIGSLIKGNYGFLAVIVLLILLSMFWIVKPDQDHILSLVGPASSGLVILFLLFKWLLAPIEKQVDNHLPTQIREVKQDLTAQVQESVKRLEDNQKALDHKIDQNYKDLSNKIDQKFDTLTNLILSKNKPD